MPPFDSLLVLTGGALLGIALIAHAATLSFRRWIDFRRLELAPDHGFIHGTAGNRIEIADLKERVRKLEAIAAGVDI